jgi:hypothetical protein
MENSRFLACLEADYRRIREVVPEHLSARVPTCPDWTVAELTRHVGQVYLHKVECMREGGLRETDWPPAGLENEEPVPDVTVTGTPADLLRWSWNRETPGEPSRVKVDGSQEALAEFGR